ncbi:guanine nucleotide exchange factor DSS4 [Nakaseomyces bracarensis]|uniref:guanine nucleotide exchange factor DSS4 n=1 Tax=Nakaseomyces bracarensis TaxID=273131 RepID=UPI0038717426
MASKVRRANCTFDECFSPLINVPAVGSTTTDRLIYLPARIMEKYKFMESRSEAEANPKEEYEFLIVPEFFDFENIAVSRELCEVEEDKENPEFKFKWDGHEWELIFCQRYLACAECDRGPIGMLCHIQDANDRSNTRRICLLSISSVSCK